MSQYIRREFERWGQRDLVLYIHGNMGFPYLLIDRQREHLGISLCFEWWADDERFYCGFPPCVLILDCRDQTYTIKSAGWDEEAVPAMIVEPKEVDISVDELKVIYQATCRRSGRRLLGLDEIRSRQEFVRWVLAERDMGSG